VNGQAVPLFYSSYGQINFQMPFETPVGQALVQVERNGQTGNTVSVQVAGLGARILPFGQYGVIQDYSQGNMLPMPITPGVPSRPAQLGDVLVIYASVWAQRRPRSRPARARQRRAAGADHHTVTVHFGPRTMFYDGIPATPNYAGMARR